MNRNPSFSFLYEDFKEILKCAKTKFEFCLFSEACEVLKELDSLKASYERPKLFMRHDVDVSLEKAFAMAQIEKDLGIKSTYMVMTDSKLYDLNDSSSIEQLDEIMTLGHEIGLHIQMRESSGISSFEKAIAPACKRLEEKIDSPVLSFAFHKPGSPSEARELFRLPLKISNRINAYAVELTGIDYESKPPLKSYLGDSRGQSLVRVKLMNYNEPLLQLLIHPIWWGLYPESGKSVCAFYREKTQSYQEELRSKIKDAISYDVNLCPPI